MNTETNTQTERMDGHVVCFLWAPNLLVGLVLGSSSSSTSSSNIHQIASAHERALKPSALPPLASRFGLASPRLVPAFYASASDHEILHVCAVFVCACAVANALEWIWCAGHVILCTRNNDERMGASAQPSYKKTNARAHHAHEQITRISHTHARAQRALKREALHSQICERSATRCVHISIQHT